MHGGYLVGNAPNGTIFIWETSNGTLKVAWATPELDVSVSGWSKNTANENAGPELNHVDNTPTEIDVKDSENYRRSPLASKLKFDPAGH